MKLIQLLEMMDNDSFIILIVSICGIQFTTRHSAGFYINQDNELNKKKIQKITMINGEMNVRLED